VVSDLLVAQDDWFSGRAKPLRQVDEEIQGFTAQPTAVPIAIGAAQLGSVLRLAGTDDGDVIATWSIAISLPIEPDAERRRHRITE
jgi:hypothetical protein